MMKTPVQLKKELDQSARQLERLIAKSKRQLLELEVTTSREELRSGKGKVYDSADDLVDKLVK